MAHKAENTYYPTLHRKRSADLWTTVIHEERKNITTKAGNYE